MKLRTLTVATLLLAAHVFTASVVVRAAENSALMEPVKSAYAEYLRIQTALANDSLDGVAENAEAITRAVQGDSMKMLPPEVAQQAEQLGNAKDLESARAALKPLSNSLITYLAKNQVAPGEFYEVFCPMAKAAWLQSEKAVKNPYMGKAMAECGQLLPKFTPFRLDRSSQGTVPGHQHQM